MVLHDEMLLEALRRWIQVPPLEPLRLANAAVNVLCCVGWFLAAAVRTPEPVTASATVTYRQSPATSIGLEVARD
jgi:hypothetical protein